MTRETTYMPYGDFVQAFEASCKAENVAPPEALTKMSTRALWTPHGLRDLLVAGHLYNGKRIRLATRFLLGVDLAHRQGQSAVACETNATAEVETV
jgi:hypothetical protein